jgi:hypothetical protein
VRELDDGTAYMMLVTCNAQGELSALEKGMHALRSGMDVKAYAASVGRARTTVQREAYAAEVASAVPIDGHELDQLSTHLVEIHAAPQWLWPALVRALLEGKGLTVEQVRAQVVRLKGTPEARAPGWSPTYAAMSKPEREHRGSRSPELGSGRRGFRPIWRKLFL